MNQCTASSAGCRSVFAAGSARRGIVLLLVLIVVTALSLAAYSFSDFMLAESQVTQLAGRRAQADAMAASGVASLQAFLMLDPTSQVEAGGYYDNPTRFQGVQVISAEEELSAGRFTVLAPALDSDGYPAGVRYGLDDESSRLNLNALLTIEEKAQAVGMETGGRDLLMALPGMTEDVADAILDWMDEDDEPREYGAEVDYYSSLDTPYAPKNGALETVEELLLVRGILPSMLFGQDVNRNGVIDETEQSQQSAGDVEEVPPTGWGSLLTLHSKEQNLNSSGEPRIDLNGDDLEQLRDALSGVFPDEWTTFILAYRQNGAYDGEEAGEDYTEGELDLAQEGKTKLTQVLDLIDAKVQVKFKGQEEAKVIRSPFGTDPAAMSEYMTTLMDSATIVAEQVIPGRINVNSAARELLAGVPGMSETAVEQIMEARGSETEEGETGRTHETWLLSEGVVTLEEMRQLSPFLCAGGSVYRAQVVGYFDDGSSAARIEVVLDGTSLPARVLLWRDISHLGRGFPLETLGVAQAEAP